MLLAEKCAYLAISTKLRYSAGRFFIKGVSMPKQFQFDGIIRNVSYVAKLTGELTEYDFLRFDVNTAKPFGVINVCNQKIAYAKWDSPNQEKARHFAGIYNIYNAPTKIVILPIMKDGGVEEKLEHVQSSILSWMNLAGI